MALAFDRDFSVTYGRCDEVAPGLRRVVAENPNAFTFLGTGTYILGRGSVAVVDPGPANDAHVEALVQALAGETVTHILVTHTHSDHSPASRALKERTGATVYGFGPHPAGEWEADEEAEPEPAAKAEAPTEPPAEPPTEARGDVDFSPDVTVGHGDRIVGEGWTVEAVHTPGHISNHLCFAVPSHGLLFSGDHVMGWSTTVISPPAGDLNAYLHSLALLLELPALPYWPTHGPCIAEPHEYVRGLHAHRRDRTRQIVEALAAGPRRISEIVAELYAGLDERLVKAAGRSVLSHLVALVADGTVAYESPSGRDHPTAGSHYRLA